MLGGVKNAIMPVLLVINLSGCVGSYISKTSGPVERDLSYALLVVPKEERKSWKPVEKNTYNDNRASFIDQKDQQNDSIGKVTKVYNNKNRWCGKTIWAIFPIPLWRPDCRTYIELTLENGEPISAREEYVEGSGYICGPFVPFLDAAKSTSHGVFCADVK